MSLSRSTFYKRPDTEVRRQREASRAALREVIEDVVEEWPAYGYRRVTRELRRRGIVANHKRIAKILRDEALTPQRAGAANTRPRSTGTVSKRWGCEARWAARAIPTDYVLPTGKEFRLDMGMILSKHDRNSIRVESEGPECRKHAVTMKMNVKGGEVMRVDFNSILLLVIAVEIALVYVKMPRK